MRRISDITGHIKKDSPVRSIGVLGRNVLQEREAAADKVQFDARLLFKNGWTAEHERAFQYNAYRCRVYLGPDIEKLIPALEQAALEDIADRNQEKEKRSQARALETSQMPPEPPDFSDIPPPSDDDIPFDFRT